MRGLQHERERTDHGTLMAMAPPRGDCAKSAQSALEVERGDAVSPALAPPPRCESRGPSAEVESNDLDKRAIAQAWIEYKQTGSLAARDLLTIYYMSGHVRRIAHRLSAQLPKLIDPEDLVQHVYRGLVRLIERFDPQRHTQFETFSSRRLVGAMRDYLRDLDTAGRQSRQRAKRLSEAESRFWARHGRRPDTAELQDLLGVRDAEEFRRFMDDARAPLTVSFASGSSSTQADANFEDADGFGSFQDQRLPSPLFRTEREDLRRWITQGLSRRDRLIIVLYYYEQMTMKEIGQTLGCSESRVSQRMDSILQCLRARLTLTGAVSELT